jgi:hypothetical protein
MRYRLLPGRFGSSAAFVRRCLSERLHDPNPRPDRITPAGSGYYSIAKYHGGDRTSGLQPGSVTPNCVRRGAADRADGRNLPQGQADRRAHADGRVGRGLSPSASRRTVREALTSHRSHQANVPVTPSSQCTNSLRRLTAMDSINRPARIFASLWRLYLRMTPATQPTWR